MLAVFDLVKLRVAIPILHVVRTTEDGMAGVRVGMFYGRGSPHH